MHVDQHTKRISISRIPSLSAVAAKALSISSANAYATNPQKCSYKQPILTTFSTTPLFRY